MSDDRKPIPESCPLEMWEVFTRHNLSYEQCINVMVATTKMIGRKAAGDERGAFLLFLQQALKICPELSDAYITNEEKKP